VIKGTAFAEESRGSHAARMGRAGEFGKRKLIVCLSLKSKEGGHSCPPL
jgi:hypothetical protein